MPEVGYKPMMPVFQLPKTFHALDHAVTVIEAVKIREPLINFI
jgi:hypothetical protein